jgi:transposase
VSGPVLRSVLDQRTLAVAIDPGKVANRVWLTTGERGLIAEPVTLPVFKQGVEELCRLISTSGVEGGPVIGIEATGALHRAWAAELERRFPGSLRLFAPSETQAARAQLGSRRFKTDDRDCAALVWLLRQGAGRRPEQPALAALQGAVSHRRQLIAQLKPLRQRLHDQLNALCPGLSAPAGHGRALKLEDPSGQAVLACAVAFRGRPPSRRSFEARWPGRLMRSSVDYWLERWRALLPPPPDAELRAERLSWDLQRLRSLLRDVERAGCQLDELLAHSPGQVLTSLPGVAVVRAAAFAAHSLPIERFPSAERLYSATGLAPASYESATVRRRGGISRQGLPEHRAALMEIALGLSQFSPAFRQRYLELRGRGMAPIEARVALARNACRLCHALLRNQQPFDEKRYRRSRHSRGR